MIFVALLFQGIVAQQPTFAPPKPQLAKCVGVNERDQLQTLTLESRWVEAEHTTVLSVQSDSSGLLKSGDWLENQNSMWKEGDRKHGLTKNWDEVGFAKRIGASYIRIALTETVISSALILYVSRKYSDDERTAMRLSNIVSIILAGHCKLYYNGADRSLNNSPPPLRTE